MPKGAFNSISEILVGGKRVVLTPVEVNEPVLALKITGAGQRATLSSLVQDGMKAVTIRVNDVEGVGGFVLPGDRVDVVLTRQTDKDKASTEIVLQNARVLAVDQSADVSADKPAVAKAVTLEVSTDQAQRVWLASSVGNLSLLLRKAGETNAESTKRITLSDFDGKAATTDTRRVVVTRGVTKQEYSVPLEGTEQKGGLLSGASRIRGTFKQGTGESNVNNKQRDAGSVIRRLSLAAALRYRHSAAQWPRRKHRS